MSLVVIASRRPLARCLASTSRRVKLWTSATCRKALSTVDHKHEEVEDKKAMNEAPILRFDDGKENPMKKAFFDSLESAIYKSLHQVKDRNIAEILQNIYASSRYAAYGYESDVPDCITNGRVPRELQEIHNILDAVIEKKQELEARLDKVSDLTTREDGPNGQADSDRRAQQEMEEVKRVAEDTALFLSKEEKKKIERALQGYRHRVDQEHNS